MNFIEFILIIYSLFLCMVGGDVVWFRLWVGELRHCVVNQSTSRTASSWPAASASVYYLGCYVV